MKANKKISEAQVEKRLMRNMRRDYKEVESQVKLSQKRIDIVAVTFDDKTIGIEIKLHDWRNGLRQASVNSIACNESYVAIWHQYAHRTDKYSEEFQRAGVGLMVIDDSYNLDLRIPCQPRSQMELSLPAHQNLLQWTQFRYA